MKRIIPETISEEELIEVLKHTKKNNHKLAYLLGFYQCLRVSEVVKLTPNNIEKTSHLIKIKQAKGSKDRNIPIIRPILLNDKTILNALKHLPIGLSISGLQKAFKNISLKVLNKDTHFHTLRHSGATWLLNKKKWNLRQIQRFLGHSNLQSTEIYTHVSAQDLVDLEWKE